MPRIAPSVFLAVVLASAALAQDQKQPPFGRTPVDGAQNVYVFRYGNNQPMFVVSTEGMIATDPIAYGRPDAVVKYSDEIKRVTDNSIKYLIYSHHRFDHIAGGNRSSKLEQASLRTARPGTAGRPKRPAGPRAGKCWEPAERS